MASTTTTATRQVDQKAESRVGRRRNAQALLAHLFVRVLLHLVVIAGGVVFAIPFYWMVRTAIMPAWQIYLYPPQWIPAAINTNYSNAIFGVFPYTRWYANTGVIAVLTVVGTVVSGSVVGFSFARLRFPFRDTLFVVLLATMMLPEQVRLIPTYLLFVKLHWINTFLPLIVPTALGPAFYVFLMRQFFMTIPPEMDDAAYIDGCSPLGVYARIALPLSLPAVGVAAIFAFTFAWNDFLNPLIYLQDVNLYTLSIGLSLFQSQLATNLQALMGAALLSMVPTVLVFFIAQRYFVQGIVLTGLKG
jgi:multiple sugar transport system permease protein